MFGAGGGGIGGPSIDSRHQQQPHHHHQQQPGGGGGGGASGGAVAAAHHPHNGLQPDQQQHAGYYAQHAGYQQWLPAQFAQFQLSTGYPPPPPHPAAGGISFYGPLPPAMQAAGMAGPLGGHGAGGDPGQPFLAMHRMLMALPPDAAPPRGWGGMQIQDQLDRRHPAYGGSGPAR